MLRRPYKKVLKSDDGRDDCLFCERSTKGEPVVLVYKPGEEPGQRVNRAHYTCCVRQPETRLRVLGGEECEASTVPREPGVFPSVTTKRSIYHGET